MNNYGYNHKIIKNLNSIETNVNIHYTYKGLNFLTKLNDNNKNLIILFHGSVKGKGIDRVIFRGYNYTINNTDIVCISDYLMNKYIDYNVNWALSSQKHNIESLYIEVFDYIINMKKYEKVIFTGSSAGGYPSIKYSCYFNCFAIISNSQLYLENYSYYYNTNHTKNDAIVSLQSLMKINDDKIIYTNKSIEKFIENSKPKKIILYCNILDYTYKNHTKPFIDFLNNSGYTNFCECILFEGCEDGKNPHSVQYPNMLKHVDILKNFLEK